MLVGAAVAQVARFVAVLEKDLTNKSKTVELDLPALLEGSYQVPSHPYRFHFASVYVVSAGLSGLLPLRSRLRTVP